MSNPGGLGWGMGPGLTNCGIGLSNTIYSEVAPHLPLPSLPVFCGAANPELRLFDELGGSGAKSSNRREILAQSSRIAALLRETDVSYLHLRDEATGQSCNDVEPSELHDQVLRCNPEAFDLQGRTNDHVYINRRSEMAERKTVEPGVTDRPRKDHLITHNFKPDPSRDQLRSDDTVTCNSQPEHVRATELVTPKKSKIKKKNKDDSFSVQPDPVVLQDSIIQSFCEMLEEFCCKAEVPGDDGDELEGVSVPFGELRVLVNELMSIRTKNLLHLVPVDILSRLLLALDHQIHMAEGLSVDNEHSDSDAVSLLLGALESIHASLAVMANSHMPKQLYKEEIIERILEFSRHQMMSVMSAHDPSYRASNKATENIVFEDDDEDPDAELGSASKKRRTVRSAKGKKSTVNRMSGAVNTILQKLCTILGLLKDLLLIERLSDSCILQLLKTSFTTFLVENIQLLQLKAISLVGGIFYSYTQHRSYVIDEISQLLWRLPSSKRALRAYLLPDEEHRQIQMVTAVLIQLVHSSANLPEPLRQASKANPMLEVTADANYITKCHEATTETCCLFWTRVLQRLTTAKSQDSSEVKLLIENLVTDLLTTLSLPEYPSSAPLLEVLCVLLLQNAGLKSKDISARSMAIDLLGTIAARLKHDAVLCSKDRFWVLEESNSANKADQIHTKECAVCLGKRIDNLLICRSCQRPFHADCMGLKALETTSRNWHCPFCVCKRQLIVLQSYCKSESKSNGNLGKSRSDEESEVPDAITTTEIVQQMLLNYLQDSGSAEDVHSYICWFYLCLWYKDDPKPEPKFMYYISRMKARSIVRDSGTKSSPLTRDSVKKITLVLGQNSSFSRGFDKILHMLLASLRENSPIIRAKALRAVSIIVEADPEVLCDKRVQLAVEGRFCDSAISVREAALELVGRHIASHPDVGLKYFEKVAERIKDTGVSVRKRAIKIIRDMCTSNPNFSESTSACAEIVSRVCDEESSIQDLVCRTFYEFWFEEPSGSQTQYAVNGSNIPLDVAKKTEQMVDLLRRMPNHQLFVTIIKRNLALDFFPQAAKAAGINPVALASVRRRCELMCQCLLEKILQVEDMSHEEVEVQVLPYMLVLHAFCVVDPGLCMPASDSTKFVITLQPYLKSQVDNKMGAQLIESIIFIINSVLPLIRKLPQSVTEELEQDLKHMIVRHSFLTVVHACIRCLCSVCKVAGKGASIVEYLLQLFYKRLDGQGADNKQVAGRSLFCLGLLIRHGNPLMNASTGNGLVVLSCLNLFKKYLNMEDFSLKVRSLQALGFVLIARPEYMLEEDIGKIIETALSSDANVRLKMQALQNIYEYLLDAENQLGSDKPSENVVNQAEQGGHSVPVAAGAGDTNICGGIVQLYWDNILGRCLDSNEQVRQTALKIMEVVLRQGLVHPITCVPYLIALETDPQEAHQKLAHHLLMNMNEKYPAFFESRLGDGLQMSFMFMQSVSGVSPELNQDSQSKVSGNMKVKYDSNSSLTQARLGVSRIYKLIRGNRVSRNKFMSSIVRKFDTPVWNDQVVPFLMYCTETLALLPFTSSDEPLYLIYTINRVIQVRAGAIEANLKASLQKDATHNSHDNGRLFQGQAQPYMNHVPMMDLNARIHEEPSIPSFGFMTSFDLNGAVLQEPVSQYDSCHPTNGEAKIHTRSSDSRELSEGEMQKIKVDCLAATALQLLLKLKRHLKVVYSLDDARCQAFAPNEPLKPGDVFSRQNIPFDISETCTTLPSVYQDLVQRYQEFKNALRDDTIDYSVYSANIKKKRPTPRKSSRSTRTMASYEEDDGDDDETWRAPSARRLSYSGRRSTRR